MSKYKNKTVWIGGLALVGLMSACASLKVTSKEENKVVPASFAGASQDSTNTQDIKWRDYYTDPMLVALIDSALKNNQELNIINQEIQISNNEVMARKGAYLPTANAVLGAGVEKSARYTRNGASEATTDIAPGVATPEALPDMGVGVFASWEVDIWHKLRNAKKAAYNKYLSSVEGKNFMVTNLVSEIANSYYELIALDNQLDIVKQNIEIQSNALNIVRQEKEATRVTELAVRRFEAEVFHTRSLQFDIQQLIVVTENKINFLVGRFPQPVSRNSASFYNIVLDSIAVGVPSQLLQNRTDIRQAELNLVSAKLDVKATKAEFYPSLNIRAGVGLQAFNPKYFIRTPQSILYNIAGDLVAPLINRNSIKAMYYNANAKQIQAVYNYERSILNAYVEVANQLSNIDNLKKSYDLKSQQVDALNDAIVISANLFSSARADYMEVLLTQRDALISKFELIDTKMMQLHAKVSMYKALGGGWR